MACGGQSLLWQQWGKPFFLPAETIFRPNAVWCCDVNPMLGASVQFLAISHQGKISRIHFGDSSLCFQK